jgi:hypothetical protein
MTESPIKLMRLADVPIADRDLVYRASPGRAQFWAVTVVIASVALGIVAWLRHSWLAGYVAIVLLLILLVTRRMVTARMRPSNWLVRMSDAGLYVQFRSYLNFRFPADDLTVAFIPFGEIRSARSVHRTSQTPDESVRGWQTKVNWLVSLELTGNLIALSQALADEREKRPPGAATYRHYPVRVISPTRVQVEWDAVPEAAAFLEALSRHTEIESPVKLDEDYVRMAHLSREEQEQRLRALAESGDTITATKVAQTLYSLDLTQARELIEKLMRGDTAPDGSA